MRCPNCKSTELKVIETRETHDFLTRRRRECLDCKTRFTTYEKIDSGNIIIEKKNKKLENFDRNKLKRGLLNAGHKRPDILKQINHILDQVEKKLTEYEKDTIPSSYLGQTVLEKLKNIDPIAYVRFASVYKQFDDINEFIKIIKNDYKE